MQYCEYALRIFQDCIPLPRYKVVNELVEVPLDRDRVELIKRRFLTLASCMNMDDFLSGWFMGAPAESVLRGNVEDFVAYGFYCRKLEELEPEVPFFLLLPLAFMPLEMESHNAF